MIYYIKIIYNRDVRNVLNLTQLNAWIDMEFILPDRGALDEVEAMLKRELPAIGACHQNAPK